MEVHVNGYGEYIIAHTAVKGVVVLDMSEKVVETKLVAYFGSFTKTF